MGEQSRPGRGARVARRPAGIWWAVLLGGLLLSAAGAGHAAEYTIGAVPVWVTPVTPGTSGANQASRGSDGVAYLLMDTQILAGEQRVVYRRLVTRAVATSGVDTAANIEIPFDPSYQKLVLHSIDIVRNGRVIPKLATAKIRVLQRETELETRIYDGTKTINVFLDDVRVGDTIDYAYSRIGRNPVFAGHDFGAMLLQFSVPVARLHARLLVPQQRHIRIATPHAAAKASVSEHDGMTDHVWDVADPPVVNVDRGAPAWYSPYAEVEWSEYQDWAAVARWAKPLYRVPARLDPALQSVVDRIAGSEPTPGGRMLAALRLVQGEVRYLGVEIGQNSHAPNPPALVFARRFGDCKDKTLLTLTLLQHLGIEARAALVNTDMQRGVADRLPNPGAFDHVLVRAHVDDKTWWIDPTRNTQNADLARLFQPDYGPALIVDDTTRGLVSMNRPAPGASGRELRVTFDVRAGFDHPVPYTVETTTRGAAAESLRASLSSTNTAQVQKNYLNFYAGDYPRITVAAPLQIHDDEAANRLTTTEHYTIGDIARRSDDGAGHVATIHVPDIAEVLRDPAVTIRSSPLQLAYPHDVSQRTEVLLSEDWPVKLGSTTIDDPAFRFVQTEQRDGLNMVITDHFQTLTDEVPAQDMPRYLANLARARKLVGYEFSWRQPAAGGGGRASGLDRMNWPVALLALGMFGLFTWLAVRAHRYDPPPASGRDTSLAGLGGWLALLTVVLVLRPVILGYYLDLTFSATSVDTWAQLTTYGSSKYNALWAPFLLFELAANLAQWVLSVWLLVLLFKRRSSFPRVAVLALLAGIVLQVGDLLLSSLVPGAEPTRQDIVATVRNSLGAAIWAAYVWRSRRVKATFVRRYRTPVPPPLPAVPAVTGRQDLALAEPVGDGS
jgi:transglutaminase-like putative cysteine protease